MSSFQHLQHIFVIDAQAAEGRASLLVQMESISGERSPQSPTALFRQHTHNVQPAIIRLPVEYFAQLESDHALIRSSHFCQFRFECRSGKEALPHSWGDSSPIPYEEVLRKEKPLGLPAHRPEEKQAERWAPSACFSWLACDDFTKVMNDR